MDKRETAGCGKTCGCVGYKHMHLTPIYNLSNDLDNGDVSRYDIPELDHSLLEVHRWEVYNERTRKERAAKATRELAQKYGPKIR